MSSPSLAPTRASGPRPGLAGAAIAVAVAGLVCLPSAPGLFGLGGLLLALAVAAGAGLGVLALFPQALVVLVPALIPSPMFLLTFAWELALYLAALLLVLHGWRTRATWLHRLSGVEVAVVAFTAWALFSGLWSDDLRWYTIGARRLLMGLVALWVAVRLPHVAARRWYDAGLMAGAGALALSALVRSLTHGMSSEMAMLRRPEVTNLGWGTANYVAGLLLLFAPSVLALALRGGRLGRLAGWGTFALVSAVQFVVASRAALLLFVVGALVQLLRFARRGRAWIVLAWLGALVATSLTPLGTAFLSRLESLRDLGSMTIRLWYFREAWARLVESLPWGLGLWQGYGNADRLQGIDPHNFWLLVGGDLGVPGLILWMLVLVVVARRARALRVDEAGREQAFTLMLTLVLANLHTLVEPTFQGAHYQLLFYWIVCGALAYGAAAGAPASAGLAASATGFSATTSSANPNRSQNTPPGT
jgi:hypothetical protein